MVITNIIGVEYLDLIIIYIILFIVFLFIHLFHIYMNQELTYVNNENKTINNNEMQQYYLGQILEKESLEVEYKEFCIKDKKYYISDRYKKLLTKEMNETDILNFVISGKITNQIMKLIHKNVIESYIIKFVPKYISSFCNSHINGEFMIGVNDEDHEITGIPYLSSCRYQLSENIIKNIIKNQFKNLRCINVNDEEVFDALDIELIDIDYTSEISEKYLENDDKEVKQQVFNYLEQIKSYYDKVDKYIQDKRDNWRKYFERYHIGLQTFIDNRELRIELAEYISKHNNNGKYNHIIDELYSHKKIIVPTGDIVKILKLKDNNLVYWLTIYRDLRKDEILVQKPKKPNLVLVNCMYPDILLKRISLIKRTISQNTVNRKNGLKFYLIKIKINGEKFKDKKYKNMRIQYRDNLKIKHKTSWVTGYRCIINDDPYCSYECDFSEYL